MVENFQDCCRSLPKKVGTVEVEKNILACKMFPDFFLPLEMCVIVFFLRVQYNCYFKTTFQGLIGGKRIFLLMCFGRLSDEQQFSMAVFSTARILTVFLLWSSGVSPYTKFELLYFGLIPESLQTFVFKVLFFSTFFMKNMTQLLQS